MATLSTTFTRTTSTRWYQLTALNSRIWNRTNSVPGLQNSYRIHKHAVCFDASRSFLHISLRSSSQIPNRNLQDDEHTNKASSKTNITSSASSTSDYPMVSWVDDYLPATFKPYARLSRMDKPIGTWLLLWPCYWSTGMAAYSNGAICDPYLLSLFTAGAFVMRGAGCTVNDLWDQDFDKNVVRTATRPLAAGDVTTPQAIAWLGVQLSVGLGVLLSLPHTYCTFCWGAASLPLVVVYPLMKRLTEYPQFVLGLTFNWGTWMGWAATFGSMDYAVIAPLYVSGIAWTMVYDTIYANQDKEDDTKLGLKSTALTFGLDGDAKQKQILHAFAALTYCGWLLSGYNLYDPLAVDSAIMPFALYASGVSAAYAHLIWQIQSADFDNPHNLAERFRSNTKVGGIVFGSIVAANLVA